MRSLIVAAVLAATGWMFLAPAGASAQNLQWGADAGRASRPGAYVPYDGAPYSERYAFYDGPLLIGPYGPQWWYQYQLDREDRAEKFGTRYGPDHPPLFNRILDRWHR
jgi:hypothetical protein